MIASVNKHRREQLMQRGQKLTMMINLREQAGSGDSSAACIPPPSMRAHAQPRPRADKCTRSRASKKAAAAPARTGVDDSDGALGIADAAAGDGEAVDHVGVRAHPVRRGRRVEVPERGQHLPRRRRHEAGVAPRARARRHRRPVRDNVRSAAGGSGGQSKKGS